MVLLTISTVSASFDPVRPNPDYWTCYDYSIDYARNNPEWGVVTMSDNPFFFGVSHMVNYRIDKDIMYIHDGLYDIEYKITNWIDNDYDYYHFWNKDEIPLRNYYYLIDNREAI